MLRQGGPQGAAGSPPRSALILAGGEFDPQGEQAHLVEGPWDLVIAADGGGRHAAALGLTPARLVGDMDSIDPGTREALKGVPTLTFPTAKEQTDSAIARIVVSDPETVENIFHEHDVAFGVCEMVVVEMREVATELAKLLAALLMAEVNMHFSYPLLTRPHGRAALALHVDDAECACSVLQGEGFKMLSQADISR